VVARTFAAGRAVVFRAWTGAEHLRRWFCPSGYTVPEARVEARLGGAFEVCMRSPDGVDHWTRGRFTEFVPDERLVIDMQVSGTQGPALFRALTAVTLIDAGGGTRVEVTQAYTLFDAAAQAMVAGAPQGWAQTLDRLGREVALGLEADPARRSVAHGSFRLERRYPASPRRVYQALADPAAKARWFSGGDGYTLLAREMDVRPGGRERVHGRWPNGMETLFDALYHDVVPEQRLVYSYTMHMDARKISVSLATFELHADGAGTRLVMTEQGAFLDGYDDSGSRERGSGHLLDALGASLGDG
jgi:uncharacterized protein YndB with AHSA1/START domain